MVSKVLFICKKNESYSAYGKKAGLLNSTHFVADSIATAHLHTEVVEVGDNNDIDREVTRVRPDVVVIEALWVVPEKFAVLKKLHPSVVWCVHLHSNMPFLALEGIAIDWVKKYRLAGIRIIVNSDEAYEGIRVILGASDVKLLHNVYRSNHLPPKAPPKNHTINIGCFGALRPMKNHLTQALAAVRFAQAQRMRLRFHINSTRSEGGDSVLKNIRALFDDGVLGELVEVGWLEHPDFLNYLATEVDLALQVSMSETFNIVTADCVTSGLPVVTSDEVDWVASSCWARTGSVNDIADRLEMVYRWPLLVTINQHNLDFFTQKAIEAWRRYFHEM